MPTADADQRLRPARDPTDPTAGLATMLAGLVSLYDVDGGAVYLTDEDGLSLRRVSAAERGTTPLELPEEVALGDGALGRTALERRAQLVRGAGRRGLRARRADRGADDRRRAAAGRDRARRAGEPAGRPQRDAAAAGVREPRRRGRPRRRRGRRQSPRARDGALPGVVVRRAATVDRSCCAADRVGLGAERAARRRARGPSARPCRSRRARARGASGRRREPRAAGTGGGRRAGDRGRTAGGCPSCRGS